jgi:hypothetical protein
MHVSSFLEHLMNVCLLGTFLIYIFNLNLHFISAELRNANYVIELLPRLSTFKL